MCFTNIKCVTQICDTFYEDVPTSGMDYPANSVNCKTGHTTRVSGVLDFEVPLQIITIFVELVNLKTTLDAFSYFGHIQIRDQVERTS